VKLAGTEATALEMEIRLVGAILARGDALYELPAGFNAGVLHNAEMRQAFIGLERLSKSKRLPTGAVDRDMVIAEGGLTDAARTMLQSAEWAADDILARGSTVRDYAQVLLERHRRAKTRAMLVGAIEAMDQGAATEDVAAGVTANLLDLDSPDLPEVISYRDAAWATLQTVERVKTGAAPTLRTGFDRIDGILRIRPGNLVIVGARSKVGKTTWARQVADGIALRAEHVLFHSLEMSVPENVVLDLSRELTIDSIEFFDERRGFSSEQWAEMHHAVERRVPQGTEGYLHSNHYHHQLGAILRISEKTHRRLLAQGGKGLALVVVDYLQLVQLDLGKHATREQVVATISRALKTWAQRTGVPVLALAQLNRDAAKRGEKPWRPPRRKKKAAPRQDPMGLPGMPPPEHPPEEPETPPEDEPTPPPQLHDLRESGALEQDANAVCFIHHPFDLATNPEKREHGPFSFIVAAQRLGPKGTVKLYADRKYSRFAEVE
jgi:replicative DNA helicase